MNATAHPFTIRTGVTGFGPDNVKHATYATYEEAEAAADRARCPGCWAHVQQLVHVVAPPPPTKSEADVDEMARRLVQQDVRYCVSGLIDALNNMAAHLSYEAQQYCQIDQDDILSICRRAPDADDYREAAEYQSKYHVVVTEQANDAGGRWHWAATGADGEPDEGRCETELEAWEEAFDFVGADRPDGAEVYEHWLVTDDLARRLRDQGETVADDIAGLTVWGRTTTGQAIYMDAVIQRIARDIVEA